MPAARRPLLPLLIAGLLLAGCGAGEGAGDSAEDFPGVEQRAVATAVEEFSDNAASRDYEAICSDGLAPALVDPLDEKRKPGGCKQAMEDALRDVSSAEVTVTKVDVQGDRASATVQENGTGDAEPRSTYALLKVDDRWKISGIALPGR